LNSNGEIVGAEFGVGIARRSEFGGDASLSELRKPEPPPEPTPTESVRTAGRGVFDVMRSRNWVVGLAVPVAAAVIVGAAFVAATGGGGTGGNAPTAQDASFEPAVLAGASFTGSNGKTQVSLTAIAASDQTKVTVGSANGKPALWSSMNGGESWNIAALGQAAAAAGTLTGAAHGKAGWLAAGTLTSGDLLLASSTSGATWTPATGLGKGRAEAVATGPGGYVVVGSKATGNSTAAAAWSSTGLTGFRPATVTSDVTDIENQLMNAVTAVPGGFVAVGQTGDHPAAWVSKTGAQWQEIQVAPPAGADSSLLDSVAVSGQMIVAAGTETAPATATTTTTSPFTEVSTDGGKTWTEVALPAPVAPGVVSPGSMVTSLTASGSGFTAVGTINTGVGPEVVVWTSLTTQVTSSDAWSPETPPLTPTGLPNATSENELTAVTTDGVILSGVGFTGSGTQKQPTLWSSPIRN
jgi:hypothetical protein